MPMISASMLNSFSVSLSASAALFVSSSMIQYWSSWYAVRRSVGILYGPLGTARAEGAESSDAEADSEGADGSAANPDAAAA